MLPHEDPIPFWQHIINDLQVKSLENQTDEWVNNDIVKIYDVVPNDGWVSCFVPVLKLHKDEKPSIRWVADFRSLNEKTEPLIVTLPFVEDNLLLFANSNIFLLWISHQVTFTFQFYEDSLKYLYGACPNFFICYTKMSFGLRNASQYFSLCVRNLHNKLPFHLQKHIVTYLDDLLGHSPTLEQHFQILNELFVILKASGVILNSPKCELFKTRLDYLGFSISFDQISVKQSYLGKISDWPTSQTLFLVFWVITAHSYPIIVKSFQFVRIKTFSQK